MDYSLYLPAFSLSFAVSLVLLSLLLLVKKIFPNKRESARHIHQKGVSRLGGVALILAFVFSLLVDPHLFVSFALKGVLIASIFILLVGVWDDLSELSWKNQLFFQIFLVTLIFIMGVRVEYITNPFGGSLNLAPENFFLPSLLFGIIWVTIFMNSMNWIDGIDGLSGGITLIGGVTIFLLSLKPEVNQPPVAIIAAALIGAVLAFLLFNFHPAKIIAGTSGSMFMGFALAVLAIFAGTKIATTLLVMVVPIIDAFWVVFERITNGQSIFKADKRHLHHKFLELGWSQRKICAFFYSITAIIAIIALNTRMIGKLMTISLAVLLVAVVLFYLNKQIYSNEKLFNLKK